MCKPKIGWFTDRPEYLVEVCLSSMIVKYDFRLHFAWNFIEKIVFQ